MKIKFIIIILCSYFTNLISQETIVLADKGNIHADTIAASVFLQKEEALVTAGDYQAALDVVLKAKALYEKHKLWEEAIRCAINLSVIDDNFDGTALKSRYAQMAISLAQSHLPKNHPLLASAFRQKAEALMMTGIIDSASYFLTKAIPIFTIAEDWTELAWSEIILGVNYLNQYQLDSAQVHFQSARNLLTRQVIPKEEEQDIQASLFSLFAPLYELQGDYDKAIENIEQALHLDLKKEYFTAVDSFHFYRYYNNLGALYLTKGDHDRALDNFNQATYIYQYALDDIDLINNLGALLNKKGEYKNAIRYLKRGLQISDNKAKQITAINNIAVAFRDMNVLDSALYYCQKAIDIPINSQKTITWTLIGDIFIRQHKTSEALKHLDIAFDTYRKDSTNSVGGAFFVSVMYKLAGDAHALNNNPETALKFYQKALIVNHANFQDSLNYEANPTLSGVYEPIHFLNAIHAKAKTLATFPSSSQKKRTALDTYQLTIDWIDILQASYSSEASQLDWSGTFKPIYEEAIQVAKEIYQTTKEVAYLDLAFAFSEKSKNAILLETLKSNEGKSQAGVPDSLIQKEKDLNLNIAFYQKTLRTISAKEANKIKLYRQYLSKTRLELAALKEQLEQDYPKFQAWKNSTHTTSIAEVQNKITNEQTAFLEYFIGDSTAYVFILTKASTSLLQLSHPELINAAIIDFRNTLSDLKAFKNNPKTAFTQYHQNGSKVFQHILKKPLLTLSKNIQQLIIIPDGLLNTIPLEALTKDITLNPDLDFASLPYLLYDYQIAYAYSADLLLKNQTRQEQLPANIKCLAFAPPYKGEKSLAQQGSLDQLRSSAGQLEGTAREIQEIAQFFDGQFDFGTNATEQEFKRKASQFGILHLAMHGVVDLDNANFNHLKFSDLQKDSLEDNLLHHYEIANMNLEAQLVVLSACETGVGKYEKGEGVFSLARSFMYAGVPSVVMSLWKVSDASTSQLMPYFYKNLADGQTKDAALHQAKLQYLKETSIEYRHPFYWSAFVVLGDAQPINTSHSNLKWWGLGLLLWALFGWAFFLIKKAKSRRNLL